MTQVRDAGPRVGHSMCLGHFCCAPGLFKYLASSQQTQARYVENKPGKGRIHRIIYFQPEVQMSSVLKTLLLCTETADKEAVTFATCPSTATHLFVTFSYLIFPRVKAESFHCIPRVEGSPWHTLGTQETFALCICFTIQRKWGRDRGILNK